MMLSCRDWNYHPRPRPKSARRAWTPSAVRCGLLGAGYIVRHQMRDRQGPDQRHQYVIYEQPQPKRPDTLYQIQLHQIRKTRIWMARIRKSRQN